jgi:hypothetical protein
MTVTDVSPAGGIEALQDVESAALAVSGLLLAGAASKVAGWWYFYLIVQRLLIRSSL